MFAFTVFPPDVPNVTTRLPSSLSAEGRCEEILHFVRRGTHCLFPFFLLTSVGSIEAIYINMLSSYNPFF